MGKALIIFSIGLALLFILSLTWGQQVFSPAQRTWFPESRIEPGKTTDQYGFTENQARLRKARFALGSFDLMNGLTLQELEGISHGDNSRSSSFLFLLACLWLVWALRKSRSPS
jgi:hypothetical protein